MTGEHSFWQEAFRRESGIRRGIILHGNVGDSFLSSGGMDGAWETVPAVVERLLKTRGFREVVFWDRVSGVSGVAPRTWRDLASSAVERDVTAEGVAYDFGEPSRTVRTPQAREQGGAMMVTPDDFLAVVSRAMLKARPDPVAFVIDWSHLLFGENNALTETERGWLLRMGKAIRDGDPGLYPIAGNGGAVVQSIVVFICQGLTVLPPILYQGNPLFKEINIPLPSRHERQAAVLRFQDLFDIDPPVQPQSRSLADMVDAMDGFTLRDIHNLAILSRQQRGMTHESLISLYRFGERHSPWEQLSHDKLRKAKETLEQRVKGQESAIEAVNRILIRAYTGLSGLQHSSKQRTPKGALFFVGPTGVGKTELARSLAQFLFGDEEACIRFDMSEFNHEHADQRLVGAPPGYVGFEQGGQLTNAVKSRPFSLLLFDEIEKAHPRILDKFLQILEDGRLTDGKGDTVQFSDTFIVFTSHIGAAQISPDVPSSRDAFIEHVRRHFVHELKRPELLGRIGGGNIIPFNFMKDEKFLVDIARVKLQPLRRRLKEKWGIKQLVFEDETRALQAVVRMVDKSSGGRGVLNALISALFDPMARFLFDEVGTPSRSEGRCITVMQAGDRPIFEFDLE